MTALVLLCRWWAAAVRIHGLLPVLTGRVVARHAGPGHGRRYRRGDHSGPLYSVATILGLLALEQECGRARVPAPALPLAEAQPINAGPYAPARATPARAVLATWRLPTAAPHAIDESLLIGQHA